MTTFYMEVPAHVQHTDQISNQIRVRGGTNWDLSRTAVATPVTRVADPVPVKGESPLDPTASPYLSIHGLPPGEPQKTVKFQLNSVVIPLSAQTALNRLPKGMSVIVVGHADHKENKPSALAEKRAAAVAAKLRKQGTEVSEIRAYGDELPLLSHDSRPQDNRRVDVFLD